MSNEKKLYLGYYSSPYGNILLASTKDYLTGLWFEGEKYYPKGFEQETEIKDTSLLVRTKQWLDIYFSGVNPDFTIPIKLNGTDFQKKVWKVLMDIPYGKTITYGEVARLIKNNKAQQAVGGAVGKNPISIIVPCHRVIATDGSLTGFSGGLDLKQKLLNLEQKN